MYFSTEILIMEYKNIWILNSIIITLIYFFTFHRFGSSLQKIILWPINSPESIQYRLVNSDIFLFEQSVWWNYRECYWMFFIYKHLRTLFVWEYDSCYNVLHFVFLWRVHLEYWAMIFSNIFSNYSSCLYSFILAAICFLKIFFLLQWSCLLLNILSFIELLYYN